jgi:hypothetical protein
MDAISKDVTDKRVALFAESVRSSTHEHVFKPNTNWWITHRKKSNDQNHPNALTYFEQIGVTKEIMTKHYGRTCGSLI